MRTRNITIFAILAGLLTLSLLLGPGKVIAQAPLSPLTTGDTFQFSQDGYYYSDAVSNTGVYDENNTALHLDERLYGAEVSNNGNANITYIETPRAPYLPNGMAMQSVTTNEPGSNWWANESTYDDFNHDGQRFWDNRTDSQDLSGQQDWKEEPIPAAGNQTYALIFPEMVDDNVQRYMDQNQVPFDLQIDYQSIEMIPLLSRNVTHSTGVGYNINGANHSLDVTRVQAEFEGTYDGSTMFWLNTPDMSIQVQANYSFYSYYYVDMTFDQGTTMLLQRYEVEEHDIFIEYGNDSITIYPPAPPPPAALNLDQSQGMNISIYGDFSTYSYTENNVSIANSNNFYGMTRPPSSGTNELQEGDFRQYFVYQKSNVNLDGTYNEDDYSRVESNSWGSEGIGNMSIDVYHHEPGYFQAAIYGGVSSHQWSDWSMTEVQPDGSSFSDSHHDDFFRFDPILQAIEGLSNATYEIRPFFDSTYWLDLPFGDNNGGNNDDNSIELPMLYTGVEQNTTEIFVNGYNRTFSTIDVFAVYGLDLINDSAVLDVDAQRGIYLNGSEEAHVEVIDGWRFDASTGILLAHIEDVSLNYNGMADGNYTDDGGMQHHVSMTRKIDMSQSFVFVLTHVPGVYTDIPTTTTPVDTNTGSTSASSNSSTTPTTTSSTASSVTESSNSTTSSSSSADLPSVPLPFVPTIVAIAVLVVVPKIRRRKD